MRYDDRVYGPVEISEPVVLELLKSPYLERLKHIDQAGYRPLWAKPDTELVGPHDHSRFAHSVGVLLLLRKYGASLEEQLAGLIHDVSHSAFSHCIDYVLEGGSESEHDHQDNIHETFLASSDIPAIIRKHGFDYDSIKDDRNFPLKERSLPDLCADRIDYSLRTAVIFGEISQAEAGELLAKLEVRNNDWVFTDSSIAERYAELFRRLNVIYYSNLISGVMFRTVGDTLKHALRSGYVSQADLYTTDGEVIAKIKNRLDSDAELKKLWHRMNRQVPFANDPERFEARVICKSRLVDPLFREEEKNIRLSDRRTDWKSILTTGSKPREYFLRFMD